MNATAVRFSREVGCFRVLTYALDDSARALCRSFGFEDLSFDPVGSIAVRIADLVNKEFGAPDRDDSS